MTAVKELKEFLATLPDETLVQVAVAKQGRAHCGYTTYEELNLHPYFGNIGVSKNLLQLGGT